MPIASEFGVAGIVLAAGFSRRLGRPKQTVVIGGETLVERTARTAREAGLAPVILVLNASIFALEADKLNAMGYTCLVNKQASEGMASSIRVGVEALRASPLSGAVVMTCDQVAVTSRHLKELVGSSEQITGSAYAGRVGVPAYFPARHFAELLTLRGDQGARDMLRAARSVATEDLALDVDTQEALQQAEVWLASHSAHSE